MTGRFTNASRPPVQPSITPHLAGARSRRGGFTYLELQVACALFAIALSGVGPLVVMQSRQLQQLETRVSDADTYYVAPSANLWARKLGAAGTLGTTVPPPPPAAPVTLIDNGDTGYTEINVGSYDWSAVPWTAAFGGDMADNVCNLSGDLASWTFPIARPGWYEVYVTYPAWPTFASNAPYRVYNGSAWQGTFRVDQRFPPDGPVFQGQPWKSIGAFLITANQLRVTLRDDALNLFIAADAVRLVPVLNTVEIQSVARSLDDEVTVVVTVTHP